jgi:hypothetical protein
MSIPFKSLLFNICCYVWTNTHTYIYIYIYIFIAPSIHDQLLFSVLLALPLSPYIHLYIFLSLVPISSISIYSHSSYFTRTQTANGLINISYILIITAVLVALHLNICHRLQKHLITCRNPWFSFQRLLILLNLSRDHKYLKFWTTIILKLKNIVIVVQLVYF